MQSNVSNKWTARFYIDRKLVEKYVNSDRYFSIELLNVEVLNDKQKKCNCIKHCMTWREHQKNGGGVHG